MNYFRSSLIVLGMATLSFAEPIIFPQQPIDFGGGLNLQAIIADNESPDQSNFIGDLQGAASKRNGSRRFNVQAISSNPFTSMYRVYASSGNSFLRALLLTTKDRIYYTTSSLDSVPFFSTATQYVTLGDNWRWVTMNNQALGFADSLKEEIKKFDVATTSMTNLFQDNSLSSETIKIRGRYPLVSRNYLIVGNCALVSTQTVLNPSTTFYASRIYYSILDTSSFTASRFIGVRTDDGEQITGLSELNNYVHIWKETSITELDFTVLNLLLLGGDQILRPIVDGFGLYAPDTLVNIGDAYIFGAKDGIRFWDGGKKTRLQAEQESRIVSDKIQPIIDRLIKFGTYKSMKAKHYPKKQWILFTYDDPLKDPVGYDSILVLDLNTLNWYPFDNWQAESFETADGIGDTGQLLYGGLGQIYFADDERSKNDARRELILDSMDDASRWTRGSQNIAQLVEGTASIKTALASDVMYSSITSMFVYPMNLWRDGSGIKYSDKLSFKVYPTSITNLVSLRVDLELDDQPGNDFNTLFTSVTVSSSAFINGQNAWSEISIPISSFPILFDWTDLSVESAPFASAQIYYGVRFFATSTVSGCTLSFDDLKVVETHDQPLNAYRFSKQFNFATSADKGFRKVVLDRESPRDGTLFVTSFNDFGDVTNQEMISGGFPKEIFVSGYKDSEGIQVLDSTDFTEKRSTIVVKEYAAFRSLIADTKNLYAADVFNHKIWKFSISTFTSASLIYGSFGHGTTNFFDPFQMAMDDNDLYIVDFGNHRVKVHSKEDLSFSRSFGELGGSTNPDKLHLPTGVAVNRNKIFIADDGNQRILELTKSTFGFVREIRIPLTTLGNTRLLVDEKYLYAFYGNVSSTNSSFTDLVLERRDLVSPDVIDARALVRSSTNSALKNGIVMGDIGQNDDFIFLSFTDDRNGNGLYYIQKILKSDFFVVKEYSSGMHNYAVSGNGLSFLPRRANTQIKTGFVGSNIQMKYSENELDNNVKLYNQSFLITPKSVKEKD